MIVQHLCSRVAARICLPLGLCLLFLAPSPVSAQNENAVRQLSDRIDELVARRWEAENVTPAPLADDAEFFRRLSLDLTGKIPAASAVRDFLSDPHPDKRRAAVEKFLSSPAYVIHNTNLWRAAMIPEAETEPEVRAALPGFEAWLRSRIAENRNLAEIVEEVLTLPLGDQSMQNVIRPDRPTPIAFYQAKENKPEELAAATARLFLGVRIDCAQCHDHPFDSWKRDQFWQHAAFFSDLPTVQEEESAQKSTPLPPGTIAIPETERTVTALFLDGQEVGPQESAQLRAQLAEWMVSPENAWFARAAANRIWSHHFGIGLVEPMDDFAASNPPSHPELLDTLAEELAGCNFDLKYLIRAITNSRTYQLTSRVTHPSQENPRLFSRMLVRGLTPEQMFDSLAQATGYRQPFDPEVPLNFNNDETRQDFLATFTNRAESASERSSTILQALSLMNGSFVSAATDLTDSRTLAAVIDAPFLSESQKIDALYLATLSRFPLEEERLRMSQHLQATSGQGPQEGLSDIFWTLLNSSEFLLNH